MLWLNLLKRIVTRIKQNELNWCKTWSKIARGLVNCVQNVRKTKYFNVTDRISVSLEKHDLVTAGVASFGDYIKNEVLADDLRLVEVVAGGEAIELPEDVRLGMLVELN